VTSRKNTCVVCGLNPAVGWAWVNDDRYCHPDEGPSCYAGEVAPASPVPVAAGDEGERGGVVEWPYDAENGEWAQRYRLPVVSSPYPGWKYHVCLAVADWPWHLVRPSEAEVRALAVALDYALDYYNAHYRASLLSKPFDLDGGTNTLTFGKRPDGGWCYRRMTWQVGPMLVPSWDAEPASLLAVLDRAFGFGDDPNPRWEAKKAANAEVLAAPEVTQVYPASPSEPSS